MIHRNHPVRTVLAVTVMLLVCAASAAARPQPYPGTAAAPYPGPAVSSTAQTGTNLCSEICSGGIASVHRHQTAHVAQFPEHPRVPINSASTPSQPKSQPAAKQPAPTSGGVDWGDAAIGAGAILLTLAVGGGLAVMARRGRQPRESSASVGG
jgi:hypothetical protein